MASLHRQLKDSALYLDGFAAQAKASFTCRGRWTEPGAEAEYDELRRLAKTLRLLARQFKSKKKRLDQEIK